MGLDGLAGNDLDLGLGEAGFFQETVQGAFLEAEPEVAELLVAVRTSTARFR